MSHFTVLVIGENPEEQLQPFHEYESTGKLDQYVVFVPAEKTLEELKNKYEENKDSYESLDEFVNEWYGYHKNEEGVYGRMTNPNAKWDWYLLGGRWTGFFKVKDVEEGFIGEPGTMTPKAEQGRLDMCKKKNIDVESMRKDARESAEKEYDDIHMIINGEEFISWNASREKFDDIDEARRFYNDQPAVKRVRQEYGSFKNVDEYLKDRESYVSLAEKSSISTFAVIKDGKWYERGSMGWWGVVTDSKDDWQEEYAKLFDSIDDEELVSVWDCHI